MKNSCLGSKVQPSRLGDYTPDGTTNDDRNVYALSGGSDYLWYSSSISVRVLTFKTL